MTRSDKHLKTVTAALSVMLFSGCSQYAVTFNEARVYTPPSLLNTAAITDSNLKGCMDQTIADRHITHTSQLTSLSCTHAGITSLEGLNTFSGLQELNISNNQITTLAPVAQLSKLNTLLASDNRIKDASALLSLLHLEFADLSSNPELPCTDILQWKNNFEGKLTLPRQCQQ